MMLRINERRMNDVVVLELKGRISAQSQDAFAATVDRLLARGDRSCVLDVAGASGAGAAVISALLGALMAARRCGGDIRLVHVTEAFDIPVMVALYGYFATFDSELDAVASFRSPASSPATAYDPLVAMAEVAAA